MSPLILEWNWSYHCELRVADVHGYRNKCKYMYMCMYIHMLNSQLCSLRCHGSFETLIAMSTASTQRLVSKSHPPLKRNLEELIDSRTEAEKEQDEPGTSFCAGK